MMMPANFSAVSENEMTYVVGGSIADLLVPAMGTEQWANVNKNLLTLVGNKYLTKVVNVAVNDVFSGSFVPGNGVTKAWNAIGAAFDSGKTAAGTKYEFVNGANGVLNAALQVAGGLAAIYNLGFGTVKNAVNDLK